MSMMPAVKAKQTLKGVFNTAPIRTNHRRDFLRENKLSLRDLQRVTTKNQTSQQQLQAPRLTRLPQQASHIGRPASRTQTQLNHQQPYHNQPTQKKLQQRPEQRTQMQPTASLVRDGRTNARKQPVWNAGNATRAGSFSGDNRRSVGPKDSVETITSMNSRAASCHKEIQTEDIQDEKFLYDALKKCSSYEQTMRSNGLNDNRATCSDPNMPLNRSVAPQSYDIESEYAGHTKYYADDLKPTAPSIHEMNGRLGAGAAEHLPMSGRSRTSIDEHELPLTARSRVSNVTVISQGHGQYPIANGHMGQQPLIERSHTTPMSKPHYNHGASDDAENLMADPAIPSVRSRISKLNDLINGEGEQRQHISQRQQYKPELNDENLNNNMQSMRLDTEDVQQQQLLDEQPLSARSRRTMISLAPSQQGSMVSKKPSRTSCSIHTVGSREDVRLPRYLEREKREKFEQRMREMEIDPMCPIGHVALTDYERRTELDTAEKQFKQLVNELNHMPMTMETLRIRNRKAEIEKELVGLEAKMRIFSKSKVYVRNEELAS